jgi:putative FmdB family regulatory protein
MPIYEFKCNKCEKIFEQLIFSSDEEENLACPSCGQRGVASRLMSSFSSGSPSSGKGLSSGLSSSCAPSSGGFS